MNSKLNYNNIKCFFVLTRFVLLWALIPFLVISCTPPRAIHTSGKVTPYKQLRVGGYVSGNMSTHFARSLYNNIESIAEPLINKDSIFLDEQLVSLNKTVLAYALDPFGMGYGFSLRYGIHNGFDLGYKLASGSHVFDAQYQFLGSGKTEHAADEGFFNGSIGVQYGFKSYKLPDWRGLRLAQKITDFNMRRRDLLLPLIFSVSIGPEETYGSASLGLVYSHTFINYGFKNSRIYDTLSSISPELLASIHGKENFPALGFFFNLKLGYKFIYVIPSCALYFQNYGSYSLFDGTKTSFKGLSFIPSLGFLLCPSEFLKKREQKASFSN